MRKSGIQFSTAFFTQYASRQRAASLCILSVVLVLFVRKNNMSHATKQSLLPSDEFDAKCSKSLNQFQGFNNAKIKKCRGLASYGGENVDAKLVCTEFLPIDKRSCVIYTFGRTDEFSFEIHAWHNWQNCMIYNFDCTRDKPAWRPRGIPHNVRSYPWCAGTENRKIGKQQYYTLKTIMNKLRHKEIDLVKIYNNKNLPQVINSFEEYRPVQISLEVDFQADLGCNGAVWEQMWSKLTDEFDYEVFGYETNHGCEMCSQYALVQSKETPRGVPKTMCSNPAETFKQVTQKYESKCNSMDRVGGGTMFGKNICTEYIPDRNSSCVIYSLGSNKQFQFEESVSVKWPHCKVFTFDCTIKHKWLPGEKPPSYTTFYDWCLGPEDKVISGDRQFFKLDTIKKRLGHDKIDLLKMDIEGYEYEIVEGFDKIVPIQIAFEVHLSKAYDCQNEKWRRFWEILTQKYGYEIVADELHPSSEMKIVADRQIIPGCWQCAEYTIVRKNQKLLG